MEQTHRSDVLNDLCLKLAADNTSAIATSYGKSVKMAEQNFEDQSAIASNYLIHKKSVTGVSESSLANL